MGQYPATSTLASCSFLVWQAVRRRKVRHLRKLLQDRHRFCALGGQISDLYPIFDEYLAESGSANGHYFHQDLLVAQLIHKAAPSRHIDVGSRVDGFVAHVASFRPIEVIDIRPMAPSAHVNIRFLQADITKPSRDLDACTDSLSCLHVVEHLGLGRYGDLVDPDGHRKGLHALARMVQPGGRMYVSSPIGHRRVCFNAHRIFDARDLPDWIGNQMSLERFDFVDDAGEIHLQQDPSSVPQLQYGCGIYTFRRIDA